MHIIQLVWLFFMQSLIFDDFMQTVENKHLSNGQLVESCVGLSVNLNEH